MNINILEAIEESHLFRPFLEDRNGSLESWETWFAGLRLLYGLPIPQKDWPAITEVTGRTQPFQRGAKTALLLTGRRSGKSRIAATIATFEASLAGHEKKLAKGEKGVVLCVSPSKSQSRIVHDYIKAALQVPLLQQMVVSETKESIELSNNIRIEIAAGDWRTVRGFTLVAAVVDEAAFLGHDAESKVKSDTELIRAIQPSLATTDGKLIAISSPYARKGWCYKTYCRNFGNNDGDILVLNAPSRTLNPTLPQRVVDAAMAEDPAAARAEYLGEFRDDIAAFLPREVIEACVVRNRHVLPPVHGISYCAFVDISGGRSDDAAVAIGHMDDAGKVVVDLLQRWTPPFNPDSVVGDMCGVLARYRVDQVVGDNYSAEFVKNSFESRGVRYERATTTDWSNNQARLVAKPKSQLYAELLPRICSGEIELLDNETLIHQLATLERKTRSGGRDIIDHPPGQHDDLANCVAGLCDVATHQGVVIGGDILGGSYGGGRNDDFYRAFDQRLAEYARQDREAFREINQYQNDNGLSHAIRSGQIGFRGPTDHFRS